MNSYTAFAGLLPGGGVSTAPDDMSELSPASLIGLAARDTKYINGKAVRAPSSGDIQSKDQFDELMGAHHRTSVLPDDATLQTKPLWEFASLTYEKDLDRFLMRPKLAFLVPPLRVFGMCTMVPPLAYPFSVYYGYGTLCTLATTRPRFTSLVPEEDRYVPGELHTVVHRRVLDRATGRCKEDVLFYDTETIQYADKLSNGETNVWFDDPRQPGIQYMLFKRKTVRKGFLWLRENFWTALFGDILMVYAPLVVALNFIHPAKRAIEDARLVSTHRLSIFDMRHPILNFFRDHKWVRPRAKVLPRLRFMGRMY
eukprot:PhM_4_TR3275/c0_g1_i1/m.103208